MSVAFAQTSVTRTYGRITIVASVTPTGYAINVFTGAVRHDTLCHTSTDRDTYRNHYRRVAEAAAADATVEQIAEAIHGPAVAVLAEVERIIATAPRPDVAALVGATARPQVAPTMAGAHLAGITDPQHRALTAAARGGAVYRGGKPGQAPVGVLTALARKGWLELTAKEGTRRSNWAYGTITEAGRVELARLDARSLATT